MRKNPIQQSSLFGLFCVVLISGVLAGCSRGGTGVTQVATPQPTAPPVSQPALVPQTMLKQQEDAQQAARLAEAIRQQAIEANTRRAAETARLEIEREQREARQHEITLVEDRIARRQETLDNLVEKSAELDTAIKTYMLDHKQAVTALVAGAAGGKVLFDSNTKSSDDAKIIAGVATGLALIWAVQNQEEVNQVSTQLAQGFTAQKNFTSQMNDLKSAIAEDQAKIAELKQLQ